MFHNPPQYDIHVTRDDCVGCEGLQRGKNCGVHSTCHIDRTDAVRSFLHLLSCLNFHAYHETIVAFVSPLSVHLLLSYSYYLEMPLSQITYSTKFIVPSSCPLNQSFSLDSKPTSLIVSIRYIYLVLSISIPTLKSHNLLSRYGNETCPTSSLKEML